MKVTVILIVIGALGSHQRIRIRTGRRGNKRKRGYHPNYSIVEIGQIIEKSPGNWRRLTATQTSVEIPQQTLV